MKLLNKYISKNEDDIIIWNEYFNEKILIINFVSKYEIMNTNLLFKYNITIDFDNNHNNYDKRISLFDSLLISGKCRLIFNIKNKK